MEIKSESHICDGRHFFLFALLHLHLSSPGTVTL